MAGRTKIVDEQEVKRWYEEGRTYGWMVEQYSTKYNIEIGETAFANVRRRRGWEPRIVHDEVLIPWSPIEKQWRWTYPITMLRLEAQRRKGETLTPKDAERLKVWKREREANNEVVAYLPNRPEGKGFYYVPRREGVDRDLIREPDVA